MKKLIQIVAAAVVSVGFVGSIASAATCTTNVVIDNSGNGNVTTVTCDNEHTATITCVNNIVVGNYNNQQGGTGSGTSSGGPVETGSVVNYNGTETKIGAACGASTTTSPSPSPSGSPSPSTSMKPAPSVKPKALPNTATNDTASIVATSLVAAVGVVALSRAAVAAYRRIGNK